MNKILLINACVRNNSRTRLLVDELLSRIEGEVIEENLEKNKLVPFTEEMLRKRDALLSEGLFSDETFAYARRLIDADVIVIAAPYWDMSFPSSIKVYVEHVMVNGLTFTYSEQGFPVGMCKAKKLYYVSTAGGPVIGENEGFTYIKNLAANYWGITDSQLFQAQNIDVIGADEEEILDEAREKIRMYFTPVRHRL